MASEAGFRFFTAASTNTMSDVKPWAACLQVAFIFTDAELKEEAFLEFINQLLATGEVAGLFARDEVDGIVNDVRPIMRAEAPGKPATPYSHCREQTCSMFALARATLPYNGWKASDPAAQ